MKITKTFSYNLPDEYLEQTDELKKSAEGTYVGPDKMYVFVNKETGLLKLSESFMPTNGKPDQLEIANTRAGLDSIAVLLNPLENELDALVASFFIPIDSSPESGYPQKEYKLDDGTVYYSRPEPTTPDHTFELTQIYYDNENKVWKTPFPWKISHITMDQHKNARDSILQSTQIDLDENINYYTDNMINAVQDFIDELATCYDKFKNIPPHMIPFPTDPRTGWLSDYDYNLDPENLIDPLTGFPKQPIQE